MTRISEEALMKLDAFIDSLPDESKSKCALCRATLTHITKQGEIVSGLGTGTVTRILADKLNEGAAPGDRVTGGALRQRVLNAEGAICRNPTNNTTTCNKEENAENKEISKGFTVDGKPRQRAKGGGRKPKNEKPQEAGIQCNVNVRDQEVPAETIDKASTYGYPTKGISGISGGALRNLIRGGRNGRPGIRPTPLSYLHKLT